jgi:hypothetical protein
MGDSVLRAVNDNVVTKVSNTRTKSNLFERDHSEWIVV